MGRTFSTPPSKSTPRAPGGPAWQTPSSPPPRIRRQPTPSPLTGRPADSRCLPSPPPPGWTAWRSMSPSRRGPMCRRAPASWTKIIRTSPRSRSPIPAAAIRAPSRCSTPRTAWRARTAVSSSPFPPTCTSTQFTMHSARRKISMAISRAICATRTPRPACSATPSPTTQTRRSRMNPIPILRTPP